MNAPSKSKPQNITMIHKNQYKMLMYLIGHLFSVQIQIYPQFAAYKLQKNYMHPLPKEYYKDIYIHTLWQATLGLHYFSMILARQTISIKGINKNWRVNPSNIPNGEPVSCRLICETNDHICKFPLNQHQISMNP